MLQKVQKVFQNAANIDQLFLRFKSDEVIAPSAAKAKIARKRAESTSFSVRTNFTDEVKSKKRTKFLNIV